MPPLAYLITLRCYGTWLPGDARGWVDRAHRAHGSPPLAARPGLERAMASALVACAFAFTARGRAVVAEAIRQHCLHRGWPLRALEVRTEHLHAVIGAAAAPPERVAIELKAWSTRQLVERGVVERGARVWSRGASARWLWTDEAVEAARRYVAEGQGAPLRGA